MTTLVQFNPVQNASPPFQALFTLDGATYLGVVKWNIAGQRWYLTLTDSSGNVAWNGPVIGSPTGYDIPLALGVFTKSKILYRPDSGNFEVSP